MDRPLAQGTMRFTPRSVEPSLCGYRVEAAYSFTFLATLSNVFEMLVPSVVAAVMMAIEMRAAIRPYSMAVAPESSAMKLVISDCVEVTKREIFTQPALARSKGTLTSKY